MTDRSLVSFGTWRASIEQTLQPASHTPSTFARCWRTVECSNPARPCAFGLKIRKFIEYAVRFHVYRHNSGPVGVAGDALHFQHRLLNCSRLRESSSRTRPQQWQTRELIARHYAHRQSQWANESTVGVCARAQLRVGRLAPLVGEGGVRLLPRRRHCTCTTAPSSVRKARRLFTSSRGAFLACLLEPRMFIIFSASLTQA